MQVSTRGRRPEAGDWQPAETRNLVNIPDTLPDTAKEAAKMELRPPSDSGVESGAETGVVLGLNRTGARRAPLRA